MVRSPVDLAARHAQEGRGRCRRQRRAAGGQAHHRPSDRARRRRQAQAQGRHRPARDARRRDRRRAHRDARRARLEPRCSGCTPTATRPPTSGPLPVDIDPERGRFSAWYEFFPRSTRAIRGPDPPRLRDAIDRLDYVADDGLRRRSTSRRSIRSASSTARVATTPSRPRPTTSAARGGSPTTSPSIPTSGRSPTCTRSSPHATRAGSSWRSTSPSSARPTTRGSRSTPSGSCTRADGTIQYAENPPKKYQDIYPAQLRDRGLAGLVGGAGRGLPVLDRAGRHDLPRRQPAHQGVPVLGVGDRRRSATSTPRRSSSPRRSPARG